jgi:hypothetical protein
VIGVSIAIAFDFGVGFWGSKLGHALFPGGLVPFLDTGLFYRDAT